MTHQEREAYNARSRSGDMGRSVQLWQKMADGGAMKVTSSLEQRRLLNRKKMRDKLAKKVRG